MQAYCGLVENLSFEDLNYSMLVPKFYEETINSWGNWFQPQWLTLEELTEIFVLALFPQTEEFLLKGEKKKESIKENLSKVANGL